MRAVLHLRGAPGKSPPLVEGPVPLREVGPPAVPLGLPVPAPIVLPAAPLVDAPEWRRYRRARRTNLRRWSKVRCRSMRWDRPGALGPPCPNADNPDTANAIASTIVVIFIAVSSVW